MVQLCRQLSPEEFAEHLRANPTPTEQAVNVKLQYLVALPAYRKFSDFLTQHYIAGYYLDFYFPQFNAALELDGSFHLQGTAKAHDALRDTALWSAGIAVYRISNSKAVNLLAAVLDAIRQKREWRDTALEPVNKPRKPKKKRAKKNPLKGRRWLSLQELKTGKPDRDFNKWLDTYNSLGTIRSSVTNET